MAAETASPASGDTDAAPAPARVQLLGEVGAVAADGTSRRLNSSQARIAAARLVLERRRSGTSRRELAETIWPEALPDTWASALRSVVTRVRRLVEDLGPGVALESIGGRYLLRLPSTVHIDVEEAVESAARAGDALGDGRPDEARTLARAAVEVLDAGFLPDHDSEWADGVRRYLGDTLVEAYDVLARAALAVADPPTALVASRALVERAPLRESGYRTLMQAQADSGNHGEALLTYARLRTMLSDELGIDPSPESEELYHGLLSAGDDRPLPASERGAASSPPSPASSPPDSAPPRRAFVGRESALDELQSVRAEAAPGRPAMAIVTGELGLGKTSTVDEFAHRVVASGGRALTCFGRGEEGRSAVGRALGDRLASLPSEVREVVEPAAAAREAAPLVRALHAYAQGEPLLLVVDDLDQADPATLDVVRSLLLSQAVAEQAPTICVVATADSSRLDSGTLRMLHDLERAGTARRIDLPRFDVVDAHDFVSTLPAAAQEDAEQLGRLLTASGGNPYLLARLVEADPSRPDLVSTLVGGLRDYTRIRMIGLCPAATRFLRAAAVSGPVFDVEVIGRAVGLDGDEAAAAVEELVRHELISPDEPTVSAAPEARRPEEYRFVHGAVCDALYADLAKTERVRIHRRLADELREQEELADSSAGQRLVALSIAAPRFDSASIEALWRAADLAGASGDVGEAVRLRSDALELVPFDDADLRTRALAALGTDELRAGAAGGRGHLLEAALVGLRRGDVGVALSAATRLIEDLSVDPDGREDARSTGEQLLEQLAGIDSRVFDDENTARPLGHFLVRHLREGGSAGDPALLARAIRAHRAAADERCHPLEGEERVELARGLAVLASRAGDRDAALLAAHHGLSAAMIRRCPEETAEFDEAWTAALDAHPESERFAHLTVERGLVRSTGGRAALGSVPLPGSREQGALGGDLTGRQRLVARWLGFRDPASWSASVAGPSGDPSTVPDADAALADLLAGRRSAARSRLRMLLTLGVPLAQDDATLHDAAALAIVAAEAGDQDLIGSMRERLQPFALVTAGHGYRSDAGPVAFHLARLASAAGDLDDAERLFLSGLTAVARSRSRVWVAAHQLGIAAVLEARGTAGDLVAAAAFRQEARRVVDVSVVRLDRFETAGAAQRH
ncbi:MULTISPECIES: BTAD domain-containing putative transcriptional regulator [unclassified Rathayibacter]|uniref:BTAD domain-containing putative transcriptional regulator n=1 Tax=unclassified Rathayibacter TaxID=2609250 RepID=UPI00188BD9C1|nr:MULTISPECIES: BTAD domain-containing putative transcriptional regulator [unclassified Rathayibacter]MBF4463166.1 AAA family ATPase [Rathayibacter sp. VKM Ac-2879]MBF4504597.1 AAA family ATPase [Rathayibacter sp. VKM Ac-2878]